MIFLISVFAFIHLIYDPKVVQSYDVYTIIKFNDIWYDYYNYSSTNRYIYFQQKFNTLSTSFQRVTYYKVETMYWHYLKKGSVTHGVYLTIKKTNLLSTTSAVTATKIAIMNAYQDATILFAQEDTIYIVDLRIFKINIICTFNQTWTNDYNDLTSYNSQLFINSFDTKIKSAFSQIYKLNLLLDKITSLRQGGVIANLNLFVIEKDYPLYEYQIRDSISSAFEIVYNATASIQIIYILPYDPKAEKSSIYTIIKFNDTWTDSYVTSPTVLQSYTSQTNLKLYESFQSVNDYELQQINWHYLKKGSVIHGVNITIMKLKQVPSTNSTTALRNAILNAFSNVSILFLQEDQIINRNLQMYRVNITCTMNQTWLNDYKNLSTYSSKVFINDFEIKIRSSFNQIYKLNLMMVRFAALSQGSVVANLNLYLSEITYPLYDYQIRDSINSAFEIAYETNASIKIESIEPYDVSTEKSNVYTICKFNDAWSNFYLYPYSIRQNYFQQKFETLSTSLLKVTNFQLQRMEWYYLKKGSVTHAVYFTIINIDLVSSMNSTTAVKNAILNAYPDASILLLKDGKLNTRPLQQYKVNVVCTFNQIWLSDYNDLSSYNSKLFIKNFENNMTLAFNQMYKLQFLYVTFTSLRQGSVTADLNLHVRETSAPLYEYQILDCINSTFQIAYDTQASIISATIMTEATRTSPTKNDPPVGMIVGIIVGIVVLAVIIGVVVYILRYKKKQESKEIVLEIHNGKEKKPNERQSSIYSDIDNPKKGKEKKPHENLSSMCYGTEYINKGNEKKPSEKPSSVYCGTEYINNENQKAQVKQNLRNTKYIRCEATLNQQLIFTCIFI